MTEIFTLNEILDALAETNLLPAIERGFVLYSEGQVIVPPVGELLFSDPPGDVHIKYGCISADKYYLVKIASGFYRNVDQGLNPNPGLMIVASQTTGAIEAVLLEEGYLTNLRTAIAGAVAAKHLAPHPLHRVAIFGTGVQARMQLQQLRAVTSCRNVVVWGRRQAALDEYIASFKGSDFQISGTLDAAEAGRDADLIVTATASEEPYLLDRMIMRSVHITAVGSDTESKRELGPGLLGRADVVVADSRGQCAVRGEIHHALHEKSLDASRIIELGTVIADPSVGRRARDQLTIADLTGVAVQDIVIASAALNALKTAP